MTLKKIVEIIHSGHSDDWTEKNKSAFDALFGTPDGRYPQAAHDSATVRAPKMAAESGVPFAAYIHPSNPTSGAYSGFSFVIFPAENQPCLLGLVVGTQGLSPDETILGRPGHARKTQAICSWLNSEFGEGKQVAWAKQDPTRTDIAVPDALKREWSSHKPALDRYGKEIYALFRPTNTELATMAAVRAFLDLYFAERGYTPLAKWQGEADTTQNKWFEHLLPDVSPERVQGMLTTRRYVILQGPPGTGKTKMALDLLGGAYQGFGHTIQFHPNTTYENFIGGLAPDTSDGSAGLSFQPLPGALWKAARAAHDDPSRPYLLHIDEINRADLGKILGEAIFLLELDGVGNSKTEAYKQRVVQLAYDFGEPFGRSLCLPKNLHLLGTMNSADRSIAIVDVAVRRRFGFISLWPQLSVVEKYGGDFMLRAFRDLISIFIEHAGDEAFPLVPGHSYFLEKDEARAKESLKINLAPLLREYLAQGYITGFAESIRNYLQELEAL
jgi:5-methylcytosine-specific restriction protein B